MQFKLHHYISVDSTNSEAHRLVEKQAVCGTVVCADIQTAGRGRREKRWVSSNKGNLLCSIIIRNQVIVTNLEVLPYLIGLAVYATITKYVQYEKVTLKWPNDVLIIGRKVAGVLIERSTNTDAVIIGIGLNIASAPQLSGYLTCALSDFIPILPTRDQILKDLLDILDNYLLLFNQTGKQEIYRLWNKYSYKNGQETTIKVNNKTYNGIFKGINNNGELVLATPESNKFFRSIDEFI